MPMESATIRRLDVPGFEGLEVIDCDVHNAIGPKLVPYLATRWQHHLATVGRRNIHTSAMRPSQRPGACRLDAFPPGGGHAGSDPEYARRQLLDEYGMTAAVLNPLDWLGGGNVPVELEIDVARATNEYNLEVWLGDDPRWRASIIVTDEHPEAAAKEIARCAERSDRFVQVMLGSRTERPPGNPKYWPIYEAAEQHGLPVAFHVGTTKYHGWTGIGPGSPTYYFEVHVGFHMAAQTMVTSLIFEGVFERFPGLQIVATELGWEWVVPFSWRMDATWRVHRDEVRHVQRPPSEYLRDHFSFSTQPCVEPERPAWFASVWEQFAQAGLAKRLLFATDYPHWDMDSPFEATPQSLPRAVKRDILAANASALYGIPLQSGEG